MGCVKLIKLGHGQGDIIIILEFRLTLVYLKSFTIGLSHIEDRGCIYVEWIHNLTDEFIGLDLMNLTVRHTLPSTLSINKHKL